MRFCMYCANCVRVNNDYFCMHKMDHPVSGESTTTVNCSWMRSFSGENGCGPDAKFFMAVEKEEQKKVEKKADKNEQKPYVFKKGFRPPSGWWVAADSDLTWFAYASKPTVVDDDQWMDCSDGQRIGIPKECAPHYSGRWQDSLQQVN